MDREVAKTKNSSDVLCCEAKVSGSAFGKPSHANGTMSCYKYRLHKPRTLGSFKCFLKQSMLLTLNDKGG